MSSSSSGCDTGTSGTDTGSSGPSVGHSGTQDGTGSGASSSSDSYTTSSSSSGSCPVSADDDGSDSGAPLIKPINLPKLPPAAASQPTEPAGPAPHPDGPAAAAGPDTASGQHASLSLSILVSMRMALLRSKKGRKDLQASVDVAASEIAASNGPLRDLLGSAGLNKLFVPVLKATGGDPTLFAASDLDDLIEELATLGLGGSVEERKQLATVLQAWAAQDSNTPGSDPAAGQGASSPADASADTDTDAAAATAAAAAAASSAGSETALATDPDILKAAAKRKFIAEEILSTENAYLAALNKIREFLVPLQAGAVRSAAAGSPLLRLTFIPGMIVALSVPRLSRAAALLPPESVAAGPESAVPTVSPAQYKAMAINLGDLVRIHEGISRELTARLEAWGPTSRIGDVFTGKSALFRQYTKFVLGYEDAVSVCNGLKQSNPDFAAYCDAFRVDPERGGLLDFTAYLLQPVQRIMRYPLLLSQLVDKTPQSHPDYRALCAALVQTSEVAHFIDNQEKLWKRLKLLDSHIEGYTREPSLARPGRRLVVEGALRIEYTLQTSKRYCLLLNDGLFVVLKIKGGGARLVLQDVFVLQDMARAAVAEMMSSSDASRSRLDFVVEIPDDADSDGSRFALHDWRNSSTHPTDLVFVAHNPKIRNEWLNEMRAMWRRHLKAAYAAARMAP